MYVCMYVCVLVGLREAAETMAPGLCFTTPPSSNKLLVYNVSDYPQNIIIFWLKMFCN